MALKKVKNPFLKTGVQMLIDQSNLDEIMQVLEWRIRRLKSQEGHEASIFRSMANFSPAFGLAGTLLGLVGMLTSLNNDVAAIGTGLAIALMTTLYGVLLANLVFRPLAVKVESRARQGDGDAG